MSLDEMSEQPIPPPSGVRWPAFLPERHARNARQLLNEAYRAGGGTVERYEDWWPQLTADPEFDAGLCFVALDEDGGELIGFAQCWTSGYVKDLAVAAPWRRRGLGQALMLRVFQTFQSRGAPHVDLKIEPGNHGAAAFYARLGMLAVET